MIKLISNTEIRYINCWNLTYWWVWRHWEVMGTCLNGESALRRLQDASGLQGRKTDHKSITSLGEVIWTPKAVPPMPVIFLLLFSEMLVWGIRENDIQVTFFPPLGYSCWHQEEEKGWVLACLAPKGDLLCSLDVCVRLFYFSEAFPDQVSWLSKYHFTVELVES